MPSGVLQVSASRSPLTSFAASASQSDRVGRALSPMLRRVGPPVPGGEVVGGRCERRERASAGLRELLGGGSLLECSAGAGDSGPADAPGAGVEVPVAPVDGAAVAAAARDGGLLRAGTRALLR